MGVVNNGGFIKVLLGWVCADDSFFVLFLFSLVLYPVSRSLTFYILTSGSIVPMPKTSLSNAPDDTKLITLTPIPGKIEELVLLCKVEHRQSGNIKLSTTKLTLTTASRQK